MRSDITLFAGQYAIDSIRNKSTKLLIPLDSSMVQSINSIFKTCPPYSFGNEPGTNAQVKGIMQGTYGITFPIASKSAVKGDSANVVYQWLSSKLQNEMMNSRTLRDFQKYLIDKTGRLVGKYDSSINPLHPSLLEGINR